MRTVKLLAVALVLALTGMVYAAGARQDAPKTQETGKAAKSCCQKHTAAQTTAATADKKHDGEGCCAMRKDTKANAQKTSATDAKAAACCSGSSCCAGGSCAKAHAQKATWATDGNAAESCCKDGGKECCKSHKTDAEQAASQTPGAKTEAAACCSGGACACCGGDKAEHKAHVGGR